MTVKKQTMYDILGVLPSATLAEIQAAHKLLSRRYITENPGLSREDISFKLSVIDVAMQTLSTPMSRDAYDAELAPLINTANLVVAPNPDNTPPISKSTALELVAAIEDNNKIASALMASQVSALTVISDTVDTTVSSLKRILKVVAAVLVLIVVVKGGGAVLNQVYAGRNGGAVSKADEKTMLQEYYQTYGVKPGSRAEMDALEVERLRKENESRATELNVSNKDQKYKDFVEESRRIGDQVSRELRHSEENARYEAQREQEKLAQEQHEHEEQRIATEKREVAKARAKLGLTTHDDQPEGE